MQAIGRFSKSKKLYSYGEISLLASCMIIISSRGMRAPDSIRTFRLLEKGGYGIVERGIGFLFVKREEILGVREELINR